MTQLYKAPYLPHLYCRPAFGQAIWSRRGRKRFVSFTNLSGWCSRSHSIRLLAVPLFVVFLLLITAGSVSGQVVTGTLTGTVTDSTGATIPNAKVAITELSTNSERTTASSTDGRYDIPYLSPGDYKVEVSAAGFKTLTQADINSSVSTVARFDAVLTPGSASETVTVTAAPPQLQTESAEVAASFEA